MGKISLELFDDGCELISFEYKKENSLTLESASYYPHTICSTFMK